jgi:cytochrome P450
MQNRKNGPRGLPLLGVLLPLQRNALRFFLRATSQYGDRVGMHVLGRQILLLCHPEDIETVLVTERNSFGRSTEIRNLQPIFGDGLLASEGCFWQRQRRLIQPRFSHVAAARYADTMIECIQQQTASWQPTAPKDIHAEMMTYTVKSYANYCLAATLVSARPR